MKTNGRKVSLDFGKLYGFKLLDSETQAKAMPKFGAKVGDKVPTKFGAKLGSKVGEKFGNMRAALLSGKIGAKEGVKIL